LPPWPKQLTTWSAQGVDSQEDLTNMTTCWWLLIGGVIRVALTLPHDE